MKGKLQTIRLVRLVGALVITCLALNTKGVDLVGQEIKNGGAEPEYYHVPKDHAAMHRAVIEARKTVGEFITALKHPAPGQQDFEVKKPFIRAYLLVGGGHHVWEEAIESLVNPR
jgi:hypothetical protein